MAVPRNPVRYATSGDPFVPTLAKPPAWHARAKCADPELRMAFWEAEAEFEKYAPADPAVIQVAKTICQQCTVRALCDREWRADEAPYLKSAMRASVRAGLTPVERQKKAKEEAA